jgi:hypothetical protein
VNQKLTGITPKLVEQALRESGAASEIEKLETAGVI